MRLGQPRPAAHGRAALGALGLAMAQLEVLGDEGGGELVGDDLVVLGRARPILGQARGVDGIRLAPLGEQPEGAQRDAALAQDLAAHLGDVAPLPDDLGLEFDVLAHRRDEGDLPGSQGRQIGEGAHRHGVGDQGRGPAIKGAPLHPVGGMGKAGRTGLAGDGFEQAGDGHGRCFAVQRGPRPD